MLYFPLVISTHGCVQIYIFMSHHCDRNVLEWNVYHTICFSSGEISRL